MSTNLTTLSDTDLFELQKFWDVVKADELASGIFSEDNASEDTLAYIHCVMVERYEHLSSWASFPEATEEENIFRTIDVHEAVEASFRLWDPTAGPYSTFLQVFVDAAILQLA